jgi:hypothetical protein
MEKPSSEKRAAPPKGSGEHWVFAAAVWFRVAGVLLLVLPVAVLFLDPLGNLSSEDTRHAPGDATANLLRQHAREILADTTGKVALVSMCVGAVLLLVGWLARE